MSKEKNVIKEIVVAMNQKAAKIMSLQAFAISKIVNANAQKMSTAAKETHLVAFAIPRQVGANAQKK